MKAKFYFILIFTVSLLITNLSFAKDYSTNLNASWNPSEPWTANNTWNEAYPQPMNLNQDRIFIGSEENDFPAHHVILTGDLDGKNKVQIYIYPNSTLEIIGNISVQNNFVINVYEGANFILDGNVTIESGNGSAANLTINGHAEITGDLSGNGVISGTGSLDVGGDIDSENIIINPDPNNDSVNVVGESEQYCAPQNLRYDVNFTSNMFSVLLIWDFDTVNCLPSYFEIKRTMNNSTEIFVRDYFAKNGFAEFEWTDSSEELMADSEPVYEVSAVYASGIKSTSEIVSFENNPLPIELLHFSAQPASDEVVVEWSTAAEINNDFFTVERSIDGSSWETLTFINGAGNANYVINYSYTDNNPIDGVSYYRLKQTDFDGQYEYFAPAAVNFSSFVSSAEIIRVVPSAQNMEVWFQNQDPNAILTVADMQGRILYNSNARVADFVQQISINLPRNYSGEVVMVNLRTNDKTDQVKLIVR